MLWWIHWIALIHAIPVTVVHNAPVNTPMSSPITYPITPAEQLHTYVSAVHVNPPSNVLAAVC